MNRPMTMQEIERVAPSVFARMPDEDRSHRYHFQPTDYLIRLFEELGYFVYDANQQGKSLTAKHALTFRKPTTEYGEGDYIPQIVVVNAHNGTSSIQILFGIFRMVCSNGMVVGQSFFKPIRIRHLECNAGSINSAIIAFQCMIPTVINMIEKMRNTGLNAYEAADLARQAALARWGSFDKFPKNFHTSDLLHSRREDDRATDLWTTYNRIQENVMRSGLPRVRTIKAIDKSIKLNQKLWDNAVALAA